MFRRQMGFVWGDSWYIHVNGGDIFQIISFDLIDSIFKCWFWFNFFCFKAVANNNGIKNLVKGCDISWIRGSGGKTFQMIIFDIINSIFKCCIRFKFCCFKAVVHTKLIKIIVKVCSNFSSRQFWLKIDWYFIYHFINFLDEWCFWVESNQLFFNLFCLLMLLFHKINQFFFWLFKDLIRFIKLGL